MKSCFKCGATKPLSEFYKHPQMPDGHVNKCKECNKRDVRENRAKKVEYYREYDRKRFQDDPRVSERNRRYGKTTAGKASAKKARERWTKNNPIKKGASTMVGNAVRDRRLFKPDYCSQCHEPHHRIHGHHDDYAFPLVVRWLCPGCHVSWHKENGEGKNCS